MEDPVVPLERNLYGNPLTGLLRERQFEKVPSEHRCLFVHREKGPFLYTKTGWKETKHRHTLIWENRHSLTTFIWVAQKENDKTSKDIVDFYRDLF